MSCFAYLLLGIFAAATVEVKTVESLAAKFSCIETKNSSENRVAGRIIYSKPNIALITTQLPYKQKMFINGSEMIIHQESSETALKITADFPQTIPYLAEFILATKEDFGLTETGFTVTNVQQAGDTLISCWAGGGEKNKLFYRISTFNNRIQSVEISRNPDFESGKNILFSNYQSFGNIDFPLQSIQTGNNGGVIKIITFDSLSINNPVQKDIRFEIGKHIKIKEYQW